MKAEDFFKLGCEHLKNKLYTYATVCFAKALSLDPAFVQAYFQLAISEKEQGNYQLALEYCDRVIKAQPNNPLAYAVLGDIYFANRMFEEAVNAYEQALHLGEDRYSMLALAYGILGDDSSARSVRLRELQKRVNLAVKPKPITMEWDMFQQRFYRMPANNPDLPTPVAGTPSNMPVN